MATRATKATTIPGTTVTVAFGVLFLVALIVMLAFGALHHDVSPKVPAVGYWVTFLVLWALRVVISLLRRR